ncbi:MAG: hypothetical protein ABI251_07835, partial [Mycobacteriaceae bacterium]
TEAPPSVAEPPVAEAEPPVAEAEPPVAEAEPEPVGAQPLVAETDADDAEPKAVAEPETDAESETDTGPRVVGVAVLLVELLAAVAVGAALWLGFRWFWGQWPVVALVLALVVSVGSVVVIRLAHRVDDGLSMLLALVVGLVVTMSPAALTLVGA